MILDEIDKNFPSARTSMSEYDPLYCLHILGPDDVIAAPSQEAAKVAADAFNTYWAGRRLDEKYPLAQVETWPHSASRHAQSLLSDWTEYVQPTKTETLPLSVAIDRAMAASDKATPGLWHLDTDCPGRCCYHIFKSEDGIYGPGEDGLINSPEMSKEDAAFIVAAVNLLRTHGQELRAYASCSLPIYYTSHWNWNRHSLAIYTRSNGGGDLWKDAIYPVMESVLRSHRLQFSHDEDGETLPLVDALSLGSSDISTGIEEITLICDAVYNALSARRGETT